MATYQGLFVAIRGDRLVDRAQLTSDELIAWLKAGYPVYRLSADADGISLKIEAMTVTEVPVVPTEIESMQISVGAAVLETIAVRKPDARGTP